MAQRGPNDDPHTDVTGRRKSRLGSIPGAGPKGAPILRKDELPDDSEAMKEKYMELQSSYQDLRALQHQHSEQYKREMRLIDPDKDGLDPNDLLRKAGSVFAVGFTALSLIATISLNTSLSLPIIAQITAAGAIGLLSEKTGLSKWISNVFKMLVNLIR